ncbi:hypothetical protein B005_4955 [Nocardiopsis alba ATCC BAA-2165]|uniref:Uncharacterized protein n=1 Tax=Nocardiopsis alba (strain ATCC BAA-2165 / BE74) TaxID=1205910 RepID=J7LDT3_NOCAA|nr:hypothetical protein B005_4955 [Nocardiopsis alba ATCC BAA-2165]
MKEVLVDRGLDHGHRADHRAGRGRALCHDPGRGDAPRGALRRVRRDRMT